jgi:hypothetical protein
MSESRVVVEREELETNLRIYLSVLGQKHPHVVRDLWTRRGEEYDRDKIQRAREQFATFVGERLYRAYEMTRLMGNMDEVAAYNRSVDGGD